MGKVTETARRLSTKLRVYRNGDAVVNALRSQISVCVASAPLAAAKEFAPAVEEGVRLAGEKLADVQDGMCMLAETVAELPRTPLAPRPKLPQRPRAESAFVNVVVELVRPSGGARAEMQLAEAMTKEITAALEGVDIAAIKGAVLPRRNFIAATVPIAFLDQLENDPRVAFVHAAEPLRLDVPDAVAARAPVSKAVGNAKSHGRGKDLLIGIIDVGGFDFSHPDFLDDEGNTRFVGIWDQGGDFRSPPTGFAYGSEFTPKHLNAALKAAGTTGLPATALEPQSQQHPSSHATHVTSIAAGKSGVCPEARIAGVIIDLPEPSSEAERRRFTFSDSSRITHAVEYLVDLAEKEGVPVSINVSLGTNGGAHDGSNGVCRWIDALLATPGRAVCIASGNAGQEAPSQPDDLGWIMGRIHTNGRIASRGLEVELEWTVVGDGIADLSENELEIWYGPQDRISVAIRPPSGGAWIEVGPRQYVENKRLRSGTTVSVYNELYHPTNGANYISIYLSPNLEVDNPRGIEAGMWRVRLRGDEIRDGGFNGWIERDDPAEIGRTRNERLFRFPSFFSAKSNVDSHSINSLACAHRVIAVANLDEKAQRISISSSQGPTRDGRCKPDVAAPGTEIVAANGFADDGTLWVSMSGTSMATPYITGVVGLMLAAKRDLTAAQCLGILQRTARPLPGATYEWSNGAGYGCLDATAAIEEAKTFNLREETR